AGIHDRRLRLQVELILPAVDPRPFENVLCLCECRVDIATRDVPYRSDELFLALRVVDREDRLEFLDVDLDRGLREADRFAVLRGNHNDRLTDEVDGVLRE